MRDRPFNWGTFLHENDENWVQPDPTRCVDQKLVGPLQYPRKLALDLGYDQALQRLRPGVELKAVQMALSWRDGELDLPRIEFEIDEFVNDVFKNSIQTQDKNIQKPVAQTL